MATRLQCCFARPLGSVVGVVVLVFATAMDLESPVTNCDFDRLDIHNVNTEMLKSLQRPTVLTHVAEAWPARSRWATAEAFVALYGDVGGFARDHDQLELRDIDTNVSAYLAGSDGLQPGVNLSDSAAFFINDYEDSRLLDRIRHDYEVPGALAHLGALRVLSLERQGAGVALHRHQASWQTLVTGRKSWYLVHPSVEAVPLQSPCSFEEEDGPPPSAEHCTLVAGDTLYVPDNWWHATCSLSSEPSFAIGAVGSMDSWAPALVAARRGDREGLELVLTADSGSSVDAFEVPPSPAGIFVGGETPLYLAAAFGHTYLVDALLANSASPTLSRRDGRTALHEASRRGDLSIVQKLLRARADLTSADEAGSNALLHACSERGSPEVIEHLLASGAEAKTPRKDGRMALHVACRGHNNPVQALRLLLKRGVSPAARDAHGMTPLMHCAAAGHGQGVGLLLRFGGSEVTAAVDNDGQNALMHALTGRGDAGVVERLLHAGMAPYEQAVASAANLGAISSLRLLVNNGASTRGALHAAAQTGHARVIHILVTDFGADPNEVNDEGEGSARPLHLAALSGHLGTVEALLALRADAAALDEDGLSPFHYASMSSMSKSHAAPVPRPLRRRAVLEALLSSAGDDIAGLKANGGVTPLHLLAASGDAMLARWLVRERRLVDPSVTDDTGNDAAAMAEQANHTSLAKLLRSWLRTDEL